MYSVKILLDSVAPSGCRLTTWELTYPRFIHSEVMAHRIFSRNTSSSRAVPVEKLIKKITENPVIPKWWGKNQPGMKADQELDGFDQEHVKKLWVEGSKAMLALAKELSKSGLHKQIANRILEPWMFTTAIVTATEHENWFALRCHEDAQPEIRWVAREMRELYRAAKPIDLDTGEWHTPLLYPEDNAYSLQDRCKISIGRCARVSYLTHDGRRAPEEDITLCGKLIASGHMSPTEHVAQALNVPAWWGNFRGWKQYRKSIPGEAVFSSKSDSA